MTKAIETCTQRIEDDRRVIDGLAQAAARARDDLAAAKAAITG